MTELNDLIKEHQATLLAAVAVLDQIALDRQSLQKRAKELEQELARLAMAQQEAAIKKIQAASALEALERLTGAGKK